VRGFRGNHRGTQNLLDFRDIMAYRQVNKWTWFVDSDGENPGRVVKSFGAE